MQKIFYIMLLSISCSAQAAHLSCEAWYREQGLSLEKTVMSLQTETANNTVFVASNHGYDFKVDWNRELTTFYVFIESAGKQILATTARVPTENHPENFTDLNLPNGPRLSVNCEMN